MNGFGTARFGRRNHGSDIEIALLRGWRPDAKCLLGEGHMRRVCIGIGINGHRRNPEPPRCAHDADGDLAAVGD